MTLFFKPSALVFALFVLAQGKTREKGLNTVKFNIKSAFSPGSTCAISYEFNSNSTAGRWLSRTREMLPQTGSMVTLTVIDSWPPPWRTPLIGGQAL